MFGAGPLSALQTGDQSAAGYTVVLIVRLVSGIWVIGNHLPRRDLRVSPFPNRLSCLRHI
jgi:hypothetical protein